MAPLDFAVIVAYFALTVGAGLWVSRHQTTAGDYFLGARNLPAWAILFSIVATETSALTVISVPGLGARGNLTFLQLTFGYLVGRIGVARWLLPGYFSGEPGDRLPAAGIALRLHHPPARVGRLPRHAAPRRRRAGLRRAIPLALRPAGRPDVDRGHGRLVTMVYTWSAASRRWSGPTSCSSRCT